LLEEALGRGVNSPGLLFPPEARLGRGEIASLEYAKPWPELCPSVSAVCADDDYQPCLGVLGVPLITVPDSSPEPQRECWYLLGGFAVLFCEGTGPSRLHFVPVG
jgi:hypothetical protein